MPDNDSYVESAILTLQTHFVTIHVEDINAARSDPRTRFLHSFRTIREGARLPPAKRGRRGLED